MVTPLEIKNQSGKPDFCTGCVIASIAEQYVGEVCDESFSYAMAKKISGEAVSKRGTDPRYTLRGAVKYGVLPKRFSPFDENTPRDILADPQSWESVMHMTILPFAGYKRVSNLKEALATTTVMAGVFWQAEWDEVPFMATNDIRQTLTPHEVRVIGHEEGYYIVQNSRGKDRGDDGLWYFREDVPFHHLFQVTTTPSLIQDLINLIDIL